jgi:hypothetical protein
MQFPGNRLVIVRKNRSVIQKTILVTFFNICPPVIIKDFNRSSYTVEFINGSILIFIAADKSKDPLLDKLKGLEIGWAGIDEANELPKEVYVILKSRLRWVLPNGSIPRYEIRLTSNPENCWLLPTFVQSTNQNEVYVPALTTDNYDENSEYVQTLREAFKDSPTLLNRYLNGDWSLVDAINALIPNVALEQSRERITNGYGTSIGVDVARYGDDNTVFVVLVNGNIDKVEWYQYTSVDQVATRTTALINEYGINPAFVGIDSVGVGAGVVDILQSNGYCVTEIQGGAKPVEDETLFDAFKPFNLRSQFYYDLRKAVMGREIGNLTNETLRAELALITYEIVAERTVKVTSKEAIKKIYGKSPDFADALAYANWVKIDRGPQALPISAGA